MDTNKSNWLAAATAAVLAVALPATALATQTGAQATVVTPRLDGPTQVRTTTAADPLASLKGAVVKDASGKPVGKVQSYSLANGTVTATVVDPSGATKPLALGSSALLIAELPAAGNAVITLDATGKVQHPVRTASTATP
jgi:hypothetical protein